ncbi:MAG: NlpC/P60 family protein [Bacteroidales bacterium]
MIGITTTTIVPLRGEPSERSEMVSQLLWGETFTLEQQTAEWLQVRSTIDGYVGWLNPLSVALIDEASLQSKLQAQQGRILNTAIAYAVHINSKQRILLPQGAVLYNYNENTGSFSLMHQTYQLETLLAPTLSASIPNICQAALALINSPYLWGGRTAMGIDCSGFTQLLYRCVGIALPRDASLQAGEGQLIDFVEQGQGADLAFFDNAQGKITHVGLLLGNGTIIHASGSVRVDKIDNEGIFNHDLNRYTHKLRIIKRLLDVKHLNTHL